MKDEDGVRIEFLPQGQAVTASVGRTLLDTAMENGIAVEHACGGVCACSTCHVIVRRGDGLLSEQSDEEWDRLDQARGVTPQSRLACQAVIETPGELVVEIPEWNTNVVSEER